MQTDGPNMKYLFEPRSIAVIGASRDKDKIGYKILDNILSGGYRGKVYPVNISGGMIHGLKAYKRVEDIHGEVDVALIAIPAQFVFDAVRSCGRKGVKFVPIITSGFSEVGKADDEKDIAEYARRHGMRILGPNIFGIYSAKPFLNATFGPARIKPGELAIVTQSGALGLAMIGKSYVENIGLSAIISIGNTSDIDETDLLEYLVPQKETKIILMYLEGVRDGERFVHALRAAAKRQPVIVIKAGRSKKGAEAAASHTGSLAGSDEIFDGLMRQAGVLRAETVEEAFNWCKFLAENPKPKGRNTLIITNGGGIGVMATDACEKYNIHLFSEHDVLKKRFSGVTPAFGSTKNPIDLTGQATAEHYNKALAAALKIRDIDSVIALYCETAVFDAESLGDMMEKNYRKFRQAGKPIAFSIFGGEAVERCLVRMSKRNVPVFGDVYHAVSGLSVLYRYHDYLAEWHGRTLEPEVSIRSVQNIVNNAIAEKRIYLLPNEAQKIMKAVNISVPLTCIAHSPHEAAQCAEKIGFPVVLKIVSRDIIHKVDVGGVELNLKTRGEVMRAFRLIMSRCGRHVPKARLEGIEVSEMVKPGNEFIVGVRRDKTFGPIAMFGLGGIYVEVMKDVSFRSVPLNRKEAMDMISEVRSHRILEGARDGRRKDTEAVIDAIMKLGSIIRSCRKITDIEINPLVVYDNGKGVSAVDVRILVSGET
jgi:acetyltransferase